jgi:hypothetical protein
VVIHLEDIAAADSRKFKLSKFIGIMNHTEYSINMVPLMATLRHDTFFSVFSCHEKSRKEVITLLAGKLCTRQEVEITKITLS